MITISDIVNKRKDRWERGNPDKGIQPHDLDHDKRLVEASVREILSSASLRDEVLAKPYLLIEACFYVVDKRKNTVPFFLNDVQRAFVREIEERGTSKPFFVLKGRQQGFTTLITAIQLSYSITRKNFSGFTLADTADNTEAIFTDKAKTVYDRLPDLLHPREKYSNRREYFFDKLNSSWRISTATADVGRSRTLNFVHFSEVAFFSCSLGELQAAIKPAIVEDAVVIYETTANGFNDAKALWDSGACVNLFYEWWLSPEYRSDNLDALNTDDGWLAARLAWLKERGLDDRQRAWYAETYAAYLDKDKIKQEYPCTPEEAFIFSGDGVFPAELLTQRMTQTALYKPLARGYFRYRKTVEDVKDYRGEVVAHNERIIDIEWVDDAQGYITIHEMPQKRDERGIVTGLAPYVLGGDTAGTGEDYFTAKVINNLTQKTAATLRKRNMDEDLYAEQVYCLGKYYNDALVAVEANFSRYPVTVLARKYNYPRLYMRERVDKTYNEVTQEPGFLTTAKTKPLAIGELVRRFRDNPAIESDRETLYEMSTFVRKENGSMAAVEGGHDDLVMALAIAHFCSGQQSMTWLPVEHKNELNEAIKRFFPGETQNAPGYGTNNEFAAWEEF